MFNNKIVKGSIISLYTYGGLRSLYYNRHTYYDDNGKKPLLGVLFYNTCRSFLLTFPFFIIYIHDDLNTLEANFSNIKNYEEFIFPINNKYTTFKINFEKEIK